MTTGAAPLLNALFYCVSTYIGCCGQCWTDEWYIRTDSISRVVCEFTWWLYIVVVELLSLLLVSVLWGCTNPLLKRGTEGIEHVTKDNRVSQLLAEIKFLFLNLKVNPPIKFDYECVFCTKWCFSRRCFDRTFLLLLLLSTWSHFSWTRVALWSTIIHSPPQVRRTLHYLQHHCVMVAAL